MANITWLGASYSNVPWLTLPKTGGGTARFDDVTDTTATASTVLSGSSFHAANGTLTSGSVTFATYYVSSSNPSGGSNGDIWLKTV
jgi:hypothetical protein